MKPEQLIIALDMQLSHCIDLIYETKDLGTMYKVGLELFVQDRHALINMLIDDRRIFLDLKLDDIPTTIRRTVRRLGTPRFLSVQGDADTVNAAIEGRHTVPGTKIIYVPTLSSREMNAQDFCKKVETAYEAGADGVVTSGWERTMNARNIGPNKTIIVPGIRLEVLSDDHKYTLTPRAALSAGADYIVVGRPISQSNTPRATVQEILHDPNI